MEKAMNRLDSVKYLEELKKEAKNDFERRFKDVSGRFAEDLLGEKPYHKDYQDVIGWMFELYKVNSTTFFSLFRNVMSGCTDLRTLKGLEEMRSFVGNFFDDSFVKLVIDENREYDHPIDGKVKMDIDPIFDWHLEWAHDDEKCLSTKELIEIMRQIYQADYEWCEKCNHHFGGDESTQTDKYDKSLLKGSK